MWILKNGWWWRWALRGSGWKEVSFAEKHHEGEHQAFEMGAVLSDVTGVYPAQVSCWASWNKGSFCFCNFHQFLQEM